MSLNADYFRDLLAPSTKSAAMLKTRSMYLARIYRNLEETANDLSFLSNFQAVMKIIHEGGNVNSAKTRIFHVMAALNTKAGKVVPAKIREKYKKEADGLKKSGNAAYRNNVMNDVQKDRYKSLLGLNLNLTAAIGDLFAKYQIDKTRSFIADDEFTKWDLPTTRNDSIYTFARDLQGLLILGCYAWQPALRNDYGTLEITKKVIGLKKDQNWLQMKKDGSINIIMNIYKNSKFMGKQVIAVINPKLRWMMHYWNHLLSKLLNKKIKYLFYYTINANHSIKLLEEQRTLSRQIPRFAEKVFNKPLTINDFRHIWEMYIQETDEYKRGTVEERTRMHEKLLHGHMMGVQYNRVRRDINIDSNEA